MYILNISFGSHILKADKIIWQNVMNKDRYSDSASISWLLQIFFTSSVFQLTVGKYVSLYGEVYFANIWWTRADIKMLDLDSGSCHHCLPFNFSHDRGKVCFLIWASLFRKYFMNQTRYRNARPRFWIPQSQSTFDVSCDRGKYLLYRKPDPWNIPQNVTSHTCDTWQMR